MADAPPSSGQAAAPEAVPQSKALHHFSDLLFDIKDALPEGKYLELCKAAQQMHTEKKPSPLPMAQGYPRNEGGSESDDSHGDLQDNAHARMSAMDHFRVMVEALRTDMRRMSDDNEGLEAQLDAATVTMDRLRERRDYYSKTSSALKGLLVSRKVPDSELLKAYERVGILNQVLRDREARKRARDVDDEEWHDALND